MRILFFILVFCNSLFGQAITLDAGTHILELTTTTAADIDYTTRVVEIVLASGGTPVSSQGKIVSATTTTIVSAPAASTYRLVKAITIRNAHVTLANVVTIKKDISATEYKVSADISLSAGEYAEYIDVLGWKVYDKNGREKISPTIDAGYDGRSIGFYKTSTASDAVGYWYCTSKDAGYPGAFAVGTPGLNGRNTDGTTTTDNGCIPFQNAASGSIYLQSSSITSTVNHYHRWFDLLWINSGLVVTTTTAQGITTPTFPARDVNGSTAGEGLMIGLLITGTTTNAAVNNTMTVNYTNSAGTNSRTATLSNNVGNMLPATALVGTIVWFNLAAGDKGVQSIQGITLATSLGAGSISLIVARPITAQPSTIVNVGTNNDYGMGIKLYSGTCLLHCMQTSATTATVISGSLVFNEK